MLTHAKHIFLWVITTILIATSLLVSIGCASSNVITDTDLINDGVPAVKINGIAAEKYIPTDSSIISEDQDNAPTSITSSISSSDDNLIVRFIDVGQGDCTLISCDGENLLIDGGPSSASSKLYSILQRLGITHLNYIIATHPDADHCGGIAGALNYASCGTFYCSVAEHTTKTFNNIVKYLGSTPVTVPSARTSFSLGGATVSFIGPVKRTLDTNNDSLVCKITYGSRSFLFTGDAETESEMQLLYSDANLDVNVLKVAHHGSDSSTSSSFINATSPQYAVISVGNNSYGHPTQNVLQRLASAGATVLRTDELGTITMITDGTGIEVSSSKGMVER